MEKEELEKARKENEIDGWIFIGEIEFKYNPFSKYIDEEPVFMYVRSISNKEKTETSYLYGFGRGILTPTLMTYFELEKRYSITTILQWFISHDQICKGADGRYELPSNKQAVRLAGMTEWILPNDEFLTKKIEIEDLEKLWRTDKENKWIEEFQHNKYASENAKKDVLMNGRYKI